MTNSAPSSTDAELFVALNEDLVLEWSGFLARERTGGAVEALIERGANMRAAEKA